MEGNLRLLVKETTHLSSQVVGSRILAVS